MEAAARDAAGESDIRARLAEESRALLQRLTVLQSTDSTNSLLARLPAEQRHAHAVIADMQTAGRGRRQRSWHSPPGGNLYLSLGWRLEQGGLPLSTLPLMTAVCVCRALDRTGLHGHGIKWPNDILVSGRKLAGILVESQSAPGGALVAVIGVGVNLSMPQAGARVIDRPWTDLAELLPAGAGRPDRDLLAALLLDALLPALETFAVGGFEPFRDEWNRRDLLAGRRVRLEGEDEVRTGKALGIEANGGLLVDIDGQGQQVLHAADVSIANA